MNLRNLIASLKAAIDSGDWITVASLAADAVKAIIGTPTVVGAGPHDGHEIDLDGLEASIIKARDTHAKAAGHPGVVGAGPVGIVDPNTVLQLVSLVFELIKQWRNRNAPQAVQQTAPQG